MAIVTQQTHPSYHSLEFYTLVTVNYCYCGCFLWLVVNHAGLEEFKCQEKLEEVKGDLTGVKITDISCRCDTTLALSGKNSYSCQI